MNKNELRDDIDFANEDIPKLFKKFLIPTLWGMFSTALFIITDGIFVGKGIGNNALAAVNVVGPFFSVAISIGLMLGMGGSILASIHLANKKIKTARIVVTQATFVAGVSLIIISLLSLLFIDELLTAIGASPEQLPLAREYGYGIIPFLVMGALMNSIPFFIRLDGAPNYAMRCSIIGAIVNIILDYLFIFEFGWGLLGAAIATSIGNTLGTVMAFVYLCRKDTMLRFVKVKMSKKAMRMSLRNIWYMCKLGGASFIGQSAVIIMIVCGNLVFVRELGTEGVAAFSICCYTFPLIYMIYTAISQSAQPIISYNYANGAMERVDKVFRISLIWSVCIGAFLVLGMVIFAPQIAALFLESGSQAYHIATRGLPLFSIGFISFAINMMTIGYFQSIEKVKMAMMIIILRGIIFMPLFFYAMPHIWSENGGWLALPATEVATNICLVFIYFKIKFHNHKV